MANIITRRHFMTTSFRATMAAALASFANVPGFVRRALAEGNIGLQGKKVLFIFFRGGNDGINNVIPIEDPAYYAARPMLGIPKDPDPLVMPRYSTATGVCDVVGPTYPYAIPLGNGFAALHPALHELAPVYNDGELALIHRVAYPRQSRSHFDSEKYWENGSPCNNGLKEGIFYRAMAESGLTGQRALMAVSVQSNMPLIIRGEYPMTNLGDPLRYNLLGVNYSNASTNDRVKQLTAIEAATLRPYPDKDNRTMVYGLGKQFQETLDIFQAINFSNNDFFDPANPTIRLFNVSDTYYRNLKAAAQILANTDAIVTGTQLGGFDTHTAQGGVTGGHANLLRRIGHTIYALKHFFSNPAYNNQGRNLWNDIVIVTLSEFGHTSIENASVGTDHAEASVMYVAGGAVKGGVYACDPSTNPTMGVPNWTPADPGWTQASPATAGGSMLAASNRYLKRAVDYRSVLGEIIRDHLGATQAQLDRIIPAYANEPVEHLKNGVSGATTPIIGELGIV
ncbi:MAG: DUF1501 domain-containing protein [Phycisphaerales bacterium]|nr:DUF1501 domain-containing protein [Phycisphaerales bacterium]